ncbi:MAG: glucose 1-dehydrogenase [Caulobacterales bacterium]
MARLKGKVAIVTGGARGLGGASADALAADGATVIITDVLDKVGEEHAAQLNKDGFNAEYHHLDVREEAAWASVVDKVVAKHGRVDVLVNNAGITNSVTIEEATLDQLKTMFDINFVGPFLGMKAVIPVMKKTGGSIVNISSNSTQMVLPQTSLYGASKAALANLTKSTAVHCAKYNIRVNSIHPGPHATDMLLGGDAKNADIPEVRALINAIPMKRMGTAKELATIVTFLASDDSSYMTASELFTDGGLTVVSFATS